MFLFINFAYQTNKMLVSNSPLILKIASPLSREQNQTENYSEVQHRNVSTIRRNKSAHGNKQTTSAKLEQAVFI